MKYFIIALVALFAIHSAYAQYPRDTWQRRMIREPNVDFDFFSLRPFPGNPPFPGSGTVAAGEVIRYGMEGNTVLLDRIEHKGPLLTRFDGNGAVEWARGYEYGNSGICVGFQQVGKRFFLHSIESDQKDNVVWNTILVTDLLGKPIRAMGIPGYQQDNKRFPFRVVPSVDGRGDIFLIGRFGLHSNGIDVLKMDSTGTILWGYSYGTFYSIDFEDAYALKYGGCVIAAAINGNVPNNPNPQTVLCRIRSNGDLEWIWKYNQELPGSEITGVAQRENEGTVVFGNTIASGNGPLCSFMEIDRDGHLLYAAGFDFGRTSTMSAVIPLSDNRIILFGNVHNGDDQPSDAFLMEYEHEGEILWCGKYGQGKEHDNKATTIAAAPEGGVALITYRPFIGSETDEITSPQLYWLKTGWRGEVCNRQWLAVNGVYDMTDYYTERKLLVEVDPVQHEAIREVSVKTFDPGITNVPRCGGLSFVPNIMEDQQGSGFSIIPNPVARGETVLIELPGIFTDATITLADIFGREVLRIAEPEIHSAGPNRTMLSVKASCLTAGVYVMRITSGGKTFDSRVIVQ